jgi:hypothetical protein
MNRRGFLAFAAAVASPVRAQEEPPGLHFSRLAAGAQLPGWLEPITFGRGVKPTEFTLVEDEGRTVLRARARASASGLARSLSVDPAARPILAWRWKAANLVERGDLRSRAGDDYALRLYVTWGSRMRLTALCYVWDRRAGAGTISPNPYSDRVQMVVADSGTGQLGRWVARERDFAADYRRAFGGEAPPVSGVIVSADTDNTGESTEAWFGDVEFRARRRS